MQITLSACWTVASSPWNTARSKGDLQSSCLVLSLIEPYFKPESPWEFLWKQSRIVSCIMDFSPSTRNSKWIDITWLIKKKKSLLSRVIANLQQFFVLFCWFVWGFFVPSKLLRFSKLFHEKSKFNYNMFTCLVWVHLSIWRVYWYYFFARMIYIPCSSLPSFIFSLYYLFFSFFLVLDLPNLLRRAHSYISSLSVSNLPCTECIVVLFSSGDLKLTLSYLACVRILDHNIQLPQVLMEYNEFSSR